jgi:hypothetical protein
MRQYRFKEAVAFHCFRCGRSKKAKLITIYAQDWNRRLCNACYGRLLSIYETIKPGTEENDEEAEPLGDFLLELFSKDQQQDIQRRYKLAERRADCLSPDALIFVASAERVAELVAERVAQLVGPEAQFDWSLAVLGLCKAVEFEIISRLLAPLTTLRGSSTLDRDVKTHYADVAKFCRNTTGKRPTLGAFAHFLHTAMRAWKGQSTSVLIQAFIGQMRNWPGASWILDPKGLHEILTTLMKLRNRAAHSHHLTMEEYANCRTLVIGSDGLLWQLVQSTQAHKK